MHASERAGHYSQYHHCRKYGGKLRARRAGRVRSGRGDSPRRRSPSGYQFGHHLQHGPRAKLSFGTGHGPGDWRLDEGSQRCHGHRRPRDRKLGIPPRIDHDARPDRAQSRRAVRRPGSLTPLRNPAQDYANQSRPADRSR